ncbi:hypothetical protein QN362_15365 [Actimicrobium sp. CCC2.4]|uniref:hypothetical protein n=1 Tax=Actimicrobium sp. CCC2.4 TaxID=3048606 RepID=UPI002AC9D384|nr:hypothetical protein [Actimicrobium sp. CCC2.4]MEB0136715.1 hypothetical protein [Actimicrobium sp. CCC2.4]WPX33179.1 hypothetical protein RHM62_04870 [Actimicrobium sp. CCC2.4]
MNHSPLNIRLSRLSCLLLLAVSASHAFAASEEIQVYMDEMNAPGAFGLDIHSNYVARGNRTPDYPGAQAPGKVFRLTPELSVGLTPTLDLGAYLLTSVGPGGMTSIDGEKLRLKFIAPKAAEQAYFWGANLEVGRVAHRLDENSWNAQLKGIIGYRTARWTMAANPNIDWKISGPVAGPAMLGMDSKLAYKTDAGYEVGAESYNGFGQIKHLGHLNQQSQTLFGVIDTDIHGWDVNLGVGRGLTPASDRWVLKAIVSVPLKSL